MRGQVEKISKEAAGHEGNGRPPVKDKGKKVEEVPKKKQRFFASKEGRSIVSP